MCMYWLKYIRLNRKDRLKITCGKTVDVAMLADISEPYRAISSVLIPMSDLAPLV